MIAFSEKAVAKVKEFAGQMPEAEGKGLRIFIQGVGCSGYSYGFTFDDEREGDSVVENDGFRLLVDAQSADHLSGAKVDFIDDHRGSGFMVDNPNTPPEMSSCGSDHGGGCSGCG